MDAFNPLPLGERPRCFLVRSDGALLPCPKAVREIFSLNGHRRRVRDLEKALAFSLDCASLDAISAYVHALQFVADHAHAAKIALGALAAIQFGKIAIPLAAGGQLSPVVASAAMAFSSVSVVMNSLRLGRFKA